MKGSAITGPVAKECVSVVFTGWSDSMFTMCAYLGGSVAAYRIERRYRRISPSHCCRMLVFRMVMTATTLSALHDHDQALRAMDCTLECSCLCAVIRLARPRNVLVHRASSNTFQLGVV